MVAVRHQLRTLLQIRILILSLSQTLTQNQTLTQISLEEETKTSLPRSQDRAASTVGTNFR